MSAFVPPADEQAEEILSDLRSDPRVTVPDGVTVDDIEKTIDPEKPVSVNFKTVLEGLRGAGNGDDEQ